MRGVRFAGLAATVALVMGSGCSSSSGGGGSHTITGRVQFEGVDSCVLDSANDVSVADQSGKVLAAATMSPIKGTGGDCYEDFTAPNVADADIYQFLESGIVVKTISRGDLAAKNWNVGTILSS